jgi:hypothetical protein
MARRDHISALSPPTIKVLAAALIYERRFGKPMTADMLMDLCIESNASEGAVFAIVLGKGMNGDSDVSDEEMLIDLDAPGPAAFEVPDDETEAALDWHGRIKRRG